MDILYGLEFRGSPLARYDDQGNKETGRISYGGFPENLFSLHWTHDGDRTSEMIVFPDSAWFAMLNYNTIVSIERIGPNVHDVPHQPDEQVTRYVIVLDP